MSNSQITARNPSSSCARATGVSCLTLVVLIVIIALWFKAEFASLPSFQQLRVCTENMQEIGGALNRYSIRNQKYPEKLTDLYPDFLENKSILHCPADPSAQSTVSYEYTPPAAMDAPDSFIVLTCRRHILMKNVPVITIVRLTKGGEISPTQVKPSDLPQKTETLKQGKQPVEKPEKAKTAPSR